MTKPWEETWKAVLAGIYIPNRLHSHASIQIGEGARLHLQGEAYAIAVHADEVAPAAVCARARLMAEAPAMWRLLAEYEWRERDNTTCPKCWRNIYGNEFEPAGIHADDCEWLRLARAIGYRP